MKLLPYFTARVLFCCIFLGIDGKRKLEILVNNPTFGWSHMQFQGKLADLLVEAGHEVHMLVLEINPSVGNYTGSNNNMICYSSSSTFGNAGEFSQNRLYRQCLQWKFLDNQQPLIKHLTEEKYDVAFSEFIHACQFGIFHKIGVHTKLATSAFMVDSYQAYHFGLQPMSSYIPNLFAPSINAPYM
ncbi:UDP-glucuronosyltransferase [Ditylenchus destructor]|nr:UDP-glucuronosyltransferase [Ditylenchus destructor]